MNGDACPIGSFVIAWQTNTAGQMLVVHVNEILQAYKSVANLSGEADVILVQATDVSHENEHYHMPNIQMLQCWYLANPKVCEVLCWRLCSIFTHVWKDLLCTINVQHNCVEQHCKATGHQDIYQECQLTTHTWPTVAHNQVLNNLVLNTAQMWDVIHVQGFRITSESLDLDDIVYQSAVNELSALKALDRSVVGKSPGSNVVSAAAGSANMSTHGRPTHGLPHPCQISHLIATA